MRFLIATALCLCSTLPVNAALLISTPAEVCSLLNEHGLATRGWRNPDGLGFYCSSPYKQIGAGFPLANNLAYYVDGTSTTVRQVKLVLNINDRNTATAAHNELLNAATALTLKVIGAQLPKVVRSAITSGGKASQKVGSAIVEVNRIDWPTGKGYEVKVIIK